MAHASPDLALRQRRLLELLAPIHDRARLTARRLCRSNADGDDLFQEAALRALLRLADLRVEASFRSWFYAILLSVHRERHRRSFWRRFVALPFGEARESPTLLAHATPYREDSYGQAARLQLALAELAVEQREAIVLFEVDGYTIEEVASLQGDSVAAVKSRLARGRQRLRKIYEAQESVAKEETAAVTERKAEIKHG